MLAVPNGAGSPGEKPWYKSVTILGGVAYALLQVAITLGFIPAGLGAELLTLATQLATLYGVRRAIG